MKTKYKTELLAPVGSPEVLSAAVTSGADAVYLGGKRFSARSSAGNFDTEEMKRALDYCRERGVKLYPAVNIAVTQQEYGEVCRYIEELARLGVDALIISDMGAIAAAREICPELPLHASTQMSLCNRAGVEFAREQGLSRVVLARETPMDDIRDIAQNCGMETEIFVHGALCVSYSGQCLMSSMAGGRSGNRGSCAQTCRKEYELSADGENFGRKYWLSTKDLCSLRFLDQLLEAGVSSLKIEGRMKRREYVAAVTSAYREAMDLCGETVGTEEKIDELARIFNRGGFTDGYFFDMGKNADRQRMYPIRPNHCGVPVGKIQTGRNGSRYLKLTRPLGKGDEIEWTKDGKSLKIQRISEPFKNGETLVAEGKNADGASLLTDDALLKKYASDGEKNLVPVTMKLTVRAGQALCLLVSDGVSAIKTEGGKAEKAENGGTSSDRLTEAISRLGGTAYRAEQAETVTDGAFVRISDVNALRRESITLLTGERIGRNTPHYQVKSAAEAENRTAYDKTEEKSAVCGSDCVLMSEKLHRPQVTVSTPYPEDLDTLTEADRIYFEPRVYDRKTLTSALDRVKTPWLILPPVLFADDVAQLETMTDVLKRFSGAMVQNPGQLVWARKFFKKIGIDRHFNILNGKSLKVYSNLCDTITLSVESTMANAKALCSQIPAEIVVYGRVAVMNTVYCPLRYLGRCDLCHKAELKDEAGRKFPMDSYRVKRCVNRIYNCLPLDMRGHGRDLQNSGASAYRLAFTDEDAETRKRITEDFVRIARGETVSAPQNEYTTALYYRGFRE